MSAAAFLAAAISKCFSLSSQKRPFLLVFLPCEDSAQRAAMLLSISRRKQGTVERARERCRLQAHLLPIYLSIKQGTAGETSGREKRQGRMRITRLDPVRHERLRGAHAARHPTAAAARRLQRHVEGMLQVLDGVRQQLRPAPQNNTCSRSLARLVASNSNGFRRPKPGVGLTPPPPGCGSTAAGSSARHAPCSSAPAPPCRRARRARAGRGGG